MHAEVYLTFSTLFSIRTRLFTFATILRASTFAFRENLIVVHYTAKYEHPFLSY